MQEVHNSDGESGKTGQDYGKAARMSREAGEHKKCAISRDH